MKTTGNGEETAFKVWSSVTSRIAAVETSVSGLETEDPASLEVVVGSEAEEGGTYQVSGKVSDQS